MGGKALQIEVLDTAGSDEYEPLRESALPTCDGFLLLYSINDQKSFKALKKIHQRIMKSCNKDVSESHPRKQTSFILPFQVPIIIVGNKIDLPRSRLSITNDEGNALAQELNAFYFYEVSVRSAPALSAEYLMTPFLLPGEEQ